MAPREGQEALLRTLHAREWRGCAGSRVCRVWGGPEGSAGEEEWSGRRREGGGQSAVQRWQRRRRRRRRRRREGDRRAAAGPRGEARRGERGAVAAEEPQLQLGRAGPGQARTSGGGGGSGSGSGGGSIAPGAGTGEASGRARCSGPLLHSPGLCLFLCRLLFHRRSCWGSRRARARAPRQSTSWVPSCLRGRRLVSSDLERAPGGGRGGRGGRPRTRRLRYAEEARLAPWRANFPGSEQPRSWGTSRVLEPPSCLLPSCLRLLHLVFPRYWGALLSPSSGSRKPGTRPARRILTLDWGLLPSPKVVSNFKS
jgi:hypothetical protein